MSFLLSFHCPFIDHDHRHDHDRDHHHRHQEESDARFVEIEESHKSEMKTMQTDFAAWTEVLLKYMAKMVLMIDRVDNSEDFYYC